MTGPFFSIERLTKRFGGLTAVNDVSFSIGRDEIVGLIGPNGAGKTTLLRLITKILRPDSGRIVFNGGDITGLRPWEVVERGIAGTFQNMRPFRHLPIIANVMVPLVAPRGRRRGEWVKSVEAKALDALEFALGCVGGNLGRHRCCAARNIAGCTFLAQCTESSFRFCGARSG